MNTPLNINTSGQPVNAPLVNGAPSLNLTGTIVTLSSSPPDRVATAAQFSAVFCGDSITQGTGATPPPVMGSIIAYSAAYVSGLRQAGFFKNGGQVFNMGLGSQRTAQGLSQYTHDQGQTGSLSCTNGSTSATFTTTPGFVIPGSLVRDLGTPANLPANTTASWTAVTTTANTSSGSTTLTVASAAGIVNGMFVICNTPDGNSVMTAGTTVTGVSGTTVTISNIMGGGGSTFTGYSFTFISPSVTLSAAYAGTTGTRTITFAGTLVSSTGTFTSGSATVTGVTVTGSSAGLVSGMGMGGASVPPGTTFTISGTTITMSSLATASGSATFLASAPTHDAATGAGYQLYVDNVNSTPHLISPAVTGASGNQYFFINYGINDAYDIVNSGASYSTWQSNYLALIALARADGYKVVVLTIIPPTSSALFGFSVCGTQVSAMNAWLKTQSANYDYLIDVAARFPSGYPAGDIYHFFDGIHPSNLGHELMAGTINDAMFFLIAPSSPLVQYPLNNGSVNDNFLSTNVPLITRNNGWGKTTGSPSTDILTIQNVTDTFEVYGSAANPGPAKLNLIGGYRSNVNGDIVDLSFGYFTIPPTADISSPQGVRVNSYQLQARVGYLQIVDVANGQNMIKFVPGSGTTGTAIFAGSIAFPTALGTKILLYNVGTNSQYRIAVNGNELALYTQNGTAAVISGYQDGASPTLLFKATSTAGTGFTLPFGASISGVGATLSLKGGANAMSGTVTLTAGSGTITSTAITTSTVIVLTLKTASGTNAYPQVACAAGSATITGLATDAGTYNWAAFLANQ